MKKYWTLSGSLENWQSSMNKPEAGYGMWAARKDTQQSKQHFPRISKNDIVFCYASGETKGLVGLGIVVDTFDSQTPFWPDEIMENKVIYPYRIRFKIVVNAVQGNRSTIKVNHLKPMVVGSINSLPPEKAEIILKLIKKQWGAKISGVTGRTLEFIIKHKYWASILIAVPLIASILDVITDAFNIFQLLSQN